MRSVAVVGGGHNAIVAALKLASKNFQVEVFEGSSALGGAARTSDWQGRRIPTGANHLGLLDDRVIEEFLDGDISQRIMRSSRYESVMKIGNQTFPFFVDPNDAARESFVATQDDIDGIAHLSKVCSRAAFELDEQIRLMNPNERVFWERLRGAFPEIQINSSMSVWSFLEHFIQSDELKAALSCNCLLSNIGPKSPGSLFALFYLSLASIRKLGGWAFPIDGFEAIFSPLIEAATRSGVKFHLGKKVEYIDCKNGTVTGITLEDGTEIPYRLVLSTLDPLTTRNKLLRGSSRAHLLDEKWRSRKFNGCAAKTNIILSKGVSAKSFSVFDGEESVGFLSYCRSVENFLSMNSEAKENGFSSFPYVEIVVPAIFDGRAQRRVISVYSLFFDYEATKKEQCRNKAQNAILKSVEDALETKLDIHSIVTWFPSDFEREFGMALGNLDHGSLVEGNTFENRPLRGWDAYQTDICGLYLGGSGSFPGGLVSASPGYNSALRIISDVDIEK